MKYFVLICILSCLFPTNADLFFVRSNEETIFEENLAMTDELLVSDSIISLAVNPFPNISDASSSFSSSIELDLDESFEESLQSNGDIDYYKFTAQYSNYFQFNIESDYSYFYSMINVYSEDDLNTPLYSYNNDLSGDLTNIPVIYAEQGDVYYFKFFNSNFVNSSNYVSYYAKLYDANVADISEDEFVSSGYVNGNEIQYNGTNNIYVYFDELTNEKPMIEHNYSYGYILRQAMVIWNRVGIMQFVEVNNENSADIIISIYSDRDNANGYYNYGYDTDTNAVVAGRLFLNDYYQYNNTYSQTLKTSLHEFGHALGLGHTNYSTNNVMIGGTRSYKGKLGQGDIACYRYLWG